MNLIKSTGDKMPYVPPQRVNVIKRYGKVEKAKTSGGVTVERQELLFIEGLDELIPCIDYSPDHFVFLDPEFKTRVGRWFAFCTCGSPAILLGGDFVDKGYSSIACKFHVDNGFHQTTIMDIKDSHETA